MEEENIYKKLEELLKKVDGNFNILEEQIDVDLQMKFFEESFQVKERKILDEEYQEMTVGLFSDNFSSFQKKEWLVYLSISSEVDHLRLIEKYLQTAEGELRSWAILALQQSRMRLSSELLDEQQVFISTGLGGKESNLRYFLAFRNKSNEEFTEFQQKIFKSEIEFNISKNEGEFESLMFHNQFATLLVLMPLHKKFQEIFVDVIEECNHLGDFIDERYIITNVKKLTIEEIEHYYRDYIESNDDDIEIEELDDEE